MTAFDPKLPLGGVAPSPHLRLAATKGYEFPRANCSAICPACNPGNGSRIVWLGRGRDVGTTHVGATHSQALCRRHRLVARNRACRDGS